jgi:hypothetical protein
MPIQMITDIFEEAFFTEVVENTPLGVDVFAPRPDVLIRFQFLSTTRTGLSFA